MSRSFMTSTHNRLWRELQFRKDIRIQISQVRILMRRQEEEGIGALERADKRKPRRDVRRISHEPPPLDK